MSKPRVLILRAPGTNCDVETAFAFETAGAAPQVVHINRVLEDAQLFAESQILCLPGGFSYGDDVAAGRILANQIHHHLADALQQFRSDGKLILGICNGFQILIKAGMLLDGGSPEAAPLGPQATLTWNDTGLFEDRWVHLAASGDKSPLLRGIDSMYLPVAHAEGKFVTSTPEVLDQLGEAGQLVLRYTDPASPEDRDVGYPHNPNGSHRAVAGICDATGRVLGLMPHPERFIDRTQHPRWTRGEAADVGDGLAMFKNAVAYFG
ncbi:MAG: phosphoribosylformylglycinamidine synthase I [Pirellulales bacterium]|nr:phosphoribosylformylglycinamidine synthase I [Pirellulales bacterium]